MAICSNDWELFSASASCRELDFTLWFEAAILSIVPICCFFLVYSLRLPILLKRTPNLYAHAWSLKEADWQLASKLACTINQAVLQTLIAIVTLMHGDRDYFDSPIVKASSILNVVAAFVMILITHQEHTKTATSGPLLPLYSLFTIPFEAARMRTFATLDLITDEKPFFAASVAALILRGFQFGLESFLSKYRLLRDHDLAEILPLEDRVCFFSRFTYFWILSLVRLARTKNLSVADLGPPPLQAEDVDRRFQAYLEKHPARRKKSLLVNLCRAFPRAMVIDPFLIFGLHAFTKTGPVLLLRAALLFLQSWATDDPQPVSYGYALVAAFGVVTVAFAFTNVSVGSSQGKQRALMTCVIVSTVTRKIYQLDPSALNGFGAGQINSFVSVDVEKIVSSSIFPSLAFHELTVLVFVLIIIYYEAEYVFLATLLSFLINVFIIPSTTDRFLTDQREWAKATDRRIRFLTSILDGWRTCKASALEAHLSKRYLSLREEELQEMKQYQKSVCYHAWIYAITFEMVRLFTIVAYVLQQKYRGDDLSPTTFFVLLAAVQILTTAYHELAMDAGTILGALNSFRRIDEFLHQPRQHRSHLCSPSTQTAELSPSIQLLDVSVTLGKNEVLTDICVTFPAGRLSILEGHTGSGKTSLLDVLLGDLKHTGSCCYSNRVSKLGYYSQTPLIIEGDTILQNILWNLPLRPDWLERCVEASDLTQDFPPKNRARPALGLSGGQKARLALCRALYQDASLYILDDVFSALDHDTASKIMQNLFGTRGLLVDKTCILVTNHAHLASAIDCHHFNLCYGKLSHIEMTESSKMQTAILAPSASSDSADADKHCEQRASGLEDPALYKSTVGACRAYWQAAGRMQSTKWAVSGLASWGIWSIGFLLLFRFLAEDLSDSLLEAWYWLAGVLSLCIVYLAVLLLWRRASIVGLPIKANRSIHQSAFLGFLQAPLSYFEGRGASYYLNRFASDSHIAETTFARSLAACFQELITFFCIAILSAIATPWVLLVFAVGIAGGESFRRFYTIFAQSVRAIGAESRSPIFGLTGDLIRGVSTFRAFDSLSSHLHLLNVNLDNVNSSAYLLILGRQFMFIFLNIAVAVLQMVLVLVAVIARSSNSFLAISLIGSLTLPFNLLNVFMEANELEVAAISVNRLSSLSTSPNEEGGLPAASTSSSDSDSEKHRKLSSDDEKLSVEDAKLLVNQAQDIIFHEVSVFYNTDTETAALDKVSFEVQKGQITALVGRTGSGKSTVFNALLRLVDISEGSISIGGRDIRKIPLQKLRSQFHVVSQDAALLQATIRYNLDSTETRTDAELWRALDLVECRNLVERLPGKLDEEVPSASFFSAGERQLLQLARIVIKPRGILLLDEPTANIDFETDQKIQRVLRSVFKDCTVLVIAHRLSTIADAHHIVRLSSGRVQDVDMHQVASDLVLDNEDARLVRGS